VGEIGGDASWSGERQPLPGEDVGLVQSPHVDLHVGSTGLPAARNGELVGIRWQMSDLVQRRRRSVRHDALLDGAGPGRNGRFKLQPRSSKIDVIWSRRGAEQVDPEGNARQQSTRRGQTLQRGVRDPGSLGLPPRDQTPLLCGSICDTVHRRCRNHYCNIPRYRGFLQHGIWIRFRLTSRRPRPRELADSWPRRAAT
jgi:hypothetical protein